MNRLWMTLENMERFCQRCRQSRIVYWNNAGTSRYCSPCLSKMEKGEPTEAQQASQKRRRLNRQQKVAIAQAWVDNYKAQRGCCCCPETDPICLDCHREDPSKKLMEISKLIKLKPDIEIIKLELQKCRVICANCYLKHHKKLREVDNAASGSDEPDREIDERLLPKLKVVSLKKPAREVARPPGFSEAMAELRRQCFPDPQEKATSLELVGRVGQADQGPEALDETALDPDVAD